MACNGVFGEGNNGVINPPKLDKTFELSQCELAVMNEDVFQLIKDFEVLTKLAKVSKCLPGLLRLVPVSV